jgi:GNAT superfamily N-acetyltransferase
MIAEYAESAAWSDYLSAAPADVAAMLNVQVCEVGGTVLICAPGTQDPIYNRAIGLGVKEPATPELIDSILQRFEQNGANQIYMQISPAVRPDETLGWLEERGFYPNGSWVKLVRGCEMPPFIETDLQIELLDASHGKDFAEVILEVFGISDSLYPVLYNTVGRPHWRHYIAYDQGYPAAAAAMYRRGDVAWLGFMGTRESHRGRGAQYALVTRRIFDAITLGCNWIVSDTFEHGTESPNRSLQNLQKLGFEVAYWRINFINF